MKEQKITEALVPLRTSESLAAYEPHNYEEAIRLANHYAKSGLLGQLGPDAVLLIMATGAEMNIPPTAALRSIHVVKGKPILSADLMVALCQKRTDVCEYFRCVESTEERATYETKRRGDEPARSTFTLEDARRAKLGLEWDNNRKQLVESSDSNWAKYPRTMLRKRAAAELARQVYPDIVLGLYSEAEEEEIARDVTPQPAPQIVARPLSEQLGVNKADLPVEGASIRDGEIVEQKPAAMTEEETVETARARWKQTLETCLTTSDADKVMRQVAKRFPEKTAPERAEINDWYRMAMARLKPGARTRQPTATAAPQQEIPIDKPREREPGEDG